jgi:hypothetical protein
MTMPKYEPLADLLTSEGRERIDLTFAHIDAVLHDPLPKTARRRREWWANNRTRHVQAQAWLDAGYEVESVDLDGKRVTFRRVRKP